MHDNDMKTTKEIQISPSKNLTIPVIFISKRQPYPVQNHQNNSLKKCIFVNSALKIHITYNVVKNAFLQTAFSVILPTGSYQ